MKMKIDVHLTSFNVSDFDDKTVQELIEYLQSYDTNATLDYSSDGVFDVWTVREETDEEYNSRLAFEERNKIAQQQSKLRQYEQLKKELGL